jgi:hypothetical protein
MTYQQGNPNRNRSASYARRSGHRAGVWGWPYDSNPLLPLRYAAAPIRGCRGRSRRQPGKLHADEAWCDVMSARWE